MEDIILTTAEQGSLRRLSTAAVSQAWGHGGRGEGTGTLHNVAPALPGAIFPFLFTVFFYIFLPRTTRTYRRRRLRLNRTQHNYKTPPNKKQIGHETSSPTMCRKMSGHPRYRLESGRSRSTRWLRQGGEAAHLLCLEKNLCLQAHITALKNHVYPDTSVSLNTMMMKTKTTDTRTLASGGNPLYSDGDDRERHVSRGGCGASMKTQKKPVQSIATKRESFVGFPTLHLIAQCSLAAVLSA